MYLCFWNGNKPSLKPWLCIICKKIQIKKKKKTKTQKVSTTGYWMFMHFLVWFKHVQSNCWKLNSMNECVKMQHSADICQRKREIKKEGTARHCDSSRGCESKPVWGCPAWHGHNVNVERRGGVETFTSPFDSCPELSLSWVTAGSSFISKQKLKLKCTIQT